jgi:GTPase
MFLFMLLTVRYYAKQVLNEGIATSLGVSQYNLSRSSNRTRSTSELELADVTTRVVQFIDLAGHQKYLKTTLHGLIGRQPEYAVLCVSAKK